MKPVNIEQYYTTRDHLLDVFDSRARKYAYQATSIAEYEEWKKNLRSALFNITGMNQMKSCQLSPVVLESYQMVGYRRDKMLIQTEDKVWMPFYVLIPDGMKEGEKRPCIIATHGHGCGKYGVVEGKENKTKTRSDYGAKLAEEGFIVFCPDARGCGERRESKDQGDEPEKFFKTSCVDLNNLAISLGQSLTGGWIWDLMRLIDYIEILDICDEKRIGCCGMSGGGLQSIWLAALDDRIKCSVVSGYFHGYRDTLLNRHSCGCNFVPHLWETADMGDLGALVTPRPLLIESGSKDPLNGPRGMVDVYEQVNITQKSYQLFEKEEVLIHHVFDGDHEWNGEKTYDFFKKWLELT